MPESRGTHDSDPFSLDRAWDAPPKADDTREEKAHYVLARYAVQNDHYNGLYQQWIKPIFFLVGKQWVTWNLTQFTYSTDTDVPPWKQQPVTNWTFAVFRTLMAKMTKQKATVEVVPPSGDSEDREASQLGQALLEFFWRYLKSPQKCLRAIGWLLATGNVGFGVDWDTEAGELRARTVLVEVPDDTNPGQTTDVECAADEHGEPLRRKPRDETDKALDGGDPYDLEAEPEVESIGDVALDVVDPLSYRWNPEATSEDDADEFFEASMWPKQRVCTEFDVAEDDIQSGGAEAGDRRQAIDDMLSSVTAGAPDPFNTKGNQPGSRRTDTQSDRVLVIKYYRNKNTKEGFPNGRHWITAGGTQVWPKENDPEYPNGEAPLPFGFWPPRVAVVDCPIPGQPQGLGVLSQVVPLNEKYNFMDGKIGEYHVTMAMGGVVWVTPADKGIRITSEPGQVKVSKGYAELGKPPIRETLTALPAPVYAERALIAQNLNAIAGVSQLDMGQRPEGVSAGRAFLVIQEASDAAIMPTLQAMERAIEEIGRRELVIAQQKYTEARTIKVKGEQGKWQYHTFVGADLRDGADVRVQAGSSAPWSKAAQWDGKMQMLTGLPGLVVNPQTGEVNEEKLARYLDSGVPGLGAFESEGDADLIEIDREHDMFEEYDPSDRNKSNQLPQLGFWQNIPKHQYYHFEFMKKDRARFEKWSPAAQMAFMEHMRETTQAVAEIAQNMTPPAQPALPAGGEQEPSEAAGPQLVPNSQAGPSPTKGAPLQLTRGDRAAAGV